jgi:hypothetical protein
VFCIEYIRHIITKMLAFFDIWHSEFCSIFRRVCRNAGIVCACVRVCVCVCVCLSVCLSVCTYMHIYISCWQSRCAGATKEHPKKQVRGHAGIVCVCVCVCMQARWYRYAGICVGATEENPTKQALHVPLLVRHTWHSGACFFS